MDLSAIVEHGGFDVMCFNKSCPSSSSSTVSESQETASTDCKPKQKERYPKNNADILSGQYGINVLLVGVALIMAVAHHGPSVKEKHLLSFITALMLVQLLWMLWYVVKRDRQKKMSEKDAHAAMSWIRAGVTVLAVLSLIMDAFRIGRYVGYKKCMSAALVVYPVVHALHTISQVHFLWCHIKDVIKSFETFERFGVIHAVFTNLLLWCNGAMTESEHFLNDHKKRLSELGYANLTIVDHKPYCNCTTSTCSIFSKSLYYLYPFNVEYHIFVSAMLFVMWKNIGRTVEPHHSKSKSVSRTGLAAGPALGLVALASTIGVLVVYTAHVDDSLETRNSAISMFYYHGIAMLGCMGVAGAAGLVIYRIDKRPLDESKNPSRQLDKEMLFGASVGTWLMSWCSVVATGASQSAPRYRWPNLAYSLLLILEKAIQNLFIIESLYRQHEDDHGKRAEAVAKPAEVFSVAASLATPFKGVLNQAYENQDGGCVPQDGDQENKQVCVCPPRRPVLPLPVAPSRAETPSRQRQILKNIAVFLILCNISLWLLPAFGCRPQYDNGLEQEILGFTVWTMVLNFAMPLNLFYRMHAVASLLEVFLHV